MLPLFHHSQPLFVIADVLVEGEERHSQVLQLDADLAKRIDESVDAFVVGHGAGLVRKQEEGGGEVTKGLRAASEPLGDDGNGLRVDEVLVVLAGGEEGLQVGSAVGL